MVIMHINKLAPEVSLPVNDYELYFVGYIFQNGQRDVEKAFNNYIS